MAFLSLEKSAEDVHGDRTTTGTADNHIWLVLVVRSLMRPDDMLETLSELAVKEPDLMRLTLQTRVAALVNVQSVEAVGAEMKRRAVKARHLQEVLQLQQVVPTAT